ncbi:hypothetical protein M427DRAFT_27252 [Gonapodya prolifera JEL478]|uniref:Nucleoporin protein Ndc1-Nup n=1 Tax=Gonapodya prolifera (strain JEL478) TaxID=1344416 RepID=A0A139AYJ2_GONPJ|nr:hypothetical protein M427DRAFT_27252 [Gonapodya prolifera JEL478]|eukprot:KXS21633.1 hypothetical protein M427DRAFT_27252 [Gonapodya prolifera JEL478]
MQSLPLASTIGALPPLPSHAGVAAHSPTAQSASPLLRTPTSPASAVVPAPAASPASTLYAQLASPLLGSRFLTSLFHSTLAIFSLTYLLHSLAHLRILSIFSLSPVYHAILSSVAIIPFLAFFSRPRPSHSRSTPPSPYAPFTSLVAPLANPLRIFAYALSAFVTVYCSARIIGPQALRDPTYYPEGIHLPARLNSAHSFAASLGIFVGVVLGTIALYKRPIRIVTVRPPFPASHLSALKAILPSTPSRALSIFIAFLALHFVVGHYIYAVASWVNRYSVGILWRIEFAPNPRYRSPHRLDLLWHLAWSVVYTVACWDVGQTIVDVELSRPIDVSYRHPDPTKCLVSGMKMKEWSYYRTLAMLELSRAVTRPARRAAIYNDIDRAPSGWAAVCEVGLSTVDELSSRVEDEVGSASGKKAATSSPVAPSASAVPLAGAFPSTPQGFMSPVHIKPALTADIVSPRKPTAVDVILMSASKAARGEDRKPVSPGIPAQDSGSAGDHAWAWSRSSPRPAVVPEAAEVGQVQTDQAQALPVLLRGDPGQIEPASPLRRRKAPPQVETPAPASVKSPLLASVVSPRVAAVAEEVVRDPMGVVGGVSWGKPVAALAIERRVRDVLGDAQAVGWVVEALATLASSSLAEDAWGTVARDVPRVLASFVRCMHALDAYEEAVRKVRSGEDSASGPLGVEGRELRGVLNVSMYAVVTSFWEHLGALKFDTKTSAVVKTFCEFRA